MSICTPRLSLNIQHSHSITSFGNLLIFLVTTLNAPAVSPFNIAKSSPHDHTMFFNTTFIPLPFAHDPQCIDSSDWVTPFFEGSDCSIAVGKFHNREYPVWSTTYLEFFTYRFQPPLPSIWAQRTPRRYRHMSCTMAIVMLRDMPPGIVPPPTSTYPTSDLASYADLERVARGILAKCISPVRSVGQGSNRRKHRGTRVGFVNPTGFGIAGKLMSVSHTGAACRCT